MGDTVDDDLINIIINPVDDSVVANSNPPTIVATLELGGSMLSRVFQ